MGEASRMELPPGDEHLAPGELLEFAEGRADGPTAARVREHLASGCASCAGEVAFWQRSLGAMRGHGAPRGPEPPDRFLEQAMAVFDCLAPQPSMWERIVSSLTTERRRAQEAVEESEAIFRLLFAHNPHPMWLCDLETLRLLEVNETAVARATRAASFSGCAFPISKEPLLPATTLPRRCAASGSTG